jgi:hypothetical protein
MENAPTMAPIESARFAGAARARKKKPPNARVAHVRARRQEHAEDDG